MLVVERSLVSQTEAPRAAFGEAHPESRFQRRKPPADRGRGRTQGHRAGGNAARLDDGAKQFNVADAR